MSRVSRVTRYEPADPKAGFTVTELLEILREADPSAEVIANVRISGQIRGLEVRSTPGGDLTETPRLPRGSR